GIIAELLQVYKRMTIALTLDETTLYDDMSELDLFYQSVTTYEVLQQTADELDIDIEPLQLITSQYEQLHEQGLTHIETHFDHRPAPVIEHHVDDYITLAEAVHPRAETEGKIQEILRLVREEK